jgi:hypothetical protein
MRREYLDLWDFPTVLLYDNCLSHLHGEIKEKLASANVRWFLPRHASTLWPFVDALRFSISKRVKYEIRARLPEGS